MKKLTLALALALFCAATAAHAVYFNGEGHGQALIFPYWTVNSASPGTFNTYLSIANRAADSKALRVKVREGRNGREVASFNLFLHWGDMWTATMIQGSEGGAWIVTSDKSCVDPPSESPGNRTALSSASYTGANADGYGQDPERLREGYVEVFEMASFRQNETDCGVLRAGIAGSLLAPTGGLTGTTTLINVADGTDFTANAEALADLATRAYFRPPSDPYPDWNIAEIDPVAFVTANGIAYRLETGQPLAAVEAALMRLVLENEVVLDQSVAAATDWIVTLPTKRLHPESTAPFQFLPDSRDVPITLRFFDREGQRLVVGEGCNMFFGCSGAEFRLPWASTVVSFRNATSASATLGVSSVLAARNGLVLGLPTSAQNGQGSLFLESTVRAAPKLPLQGSRFAVRTGTLTTAVTSTFVGLPVLGFMVRSFRNGNLNCGAVTCQGNYGGALPHAYMRFVE